MEFDLPNGAEVNYNEKNKTITLSDWFLDEYQVIVLEREDVILLSAFLTEIYNG